MDPDNLRTASAYINNLLLSRGLLRNGQAIDFANPDQDGKGSGSTMGRVMTLVNDLILRRDRDAEQRESLSNTIRTLRADTLRQITEYERLQTKYDESQRRLGLADATERALKLQLKSAEQAAKGLKEEMGRMKMLVGQTRAQCANEVRKRERVIEGLKRHVGEGGRPRGSGKAVGVATINVLAGVSTEQSSSQAVGISESGYDLCMETNEFLTDLARGLSEENEHLTSLTRKTVETLKSMSGWERPGEEENGLILQKDSGFENISAETDSVIEHLRTLLTNPSFVPLEEVEVREDEIIRLRDGWEKMESRWREAVQLMDGWRKRMAQSGQTVNLEELRMGLRLSPVKVPDVEEIQNQELELAEVEIEGDTQADIDAMDDSQVPAAPDLDVESDEASTLGDHHGEELVPEDHDKTFDTVSSDLGPPPQLSPLHDATDHGNRRTNFTTIVEENTYDLAHIQYSENSTENIVQTEDEFSLIKTSTQAALRKPVSPIKVENQSRLPRPAAALAQQSPLTMASIAAKLAATEREADAARVRAKLKAAKAAAATTLRPPVTIPDDHREPAKENIESVVEEAAPRKRKAQKSLGGRASRRRSTLSPWELESLILGGANPPAKV